MKKPFFFMLLIMSMCFSNFSALGQVDIPDPVLKAFEKQFTKVHQRDVSWSFKNKAYIADIYDQDQCKDVFYDEKGNWLKTVTDILEADLPGNIMEQVRSTFTDIEFIFSTQLIQNPERSEYKVVFETLKEYIVMIFDTEGKVLDKKVKKLE